MNISEWEEWVTHVKALIKFLKRYSHLIDDSFSEKFWETKLIAKEKMKPSLSLGLQRILCINPENQRKGPVHIKAQNQPNVAKSSNATCPKMLTSPCWCGFMRREASLFYCNRLVVWLRHESMKETFRSYLMLRFQVRTVSIHTIDWVEFGCAGPRMWTFSKF